MAYRPVATGIGTIAGYLAALLGLSFYARRTIGARLWRRAHRLTIVVWLMAAIHALTAGTDASTPWMRAILVASAVPIGALFVARVVGGRRRPSPRPVEVAA
jgi:sulfoxide reductase heme-binding subunit YedZ